MNKPPLYIDKGKKLPQFDLPVDFLVYDDIRADLLKFYANFPCKVETCIIAYVEKGTLKASVNLQDIVVNEHDFAIVMPGSFLLINEVSDDIKVSFAGYSAAFLKRINFFKIMSPLLNEIFKRPAISLTPEMGEFYSGFFSLFTTASAMPDIFMTTGIAQSVLNILMESMSNAINAGVLKTTKTTSREQIIVSEFYQLALENYREEHKISFYAREANLTLSHFCNVVSKTSGMTPQEIIMNMIIMDAKSQLKGTQATVTAIGKSLGFSTLTTFNRYFKNYTGITPQEYRNS